MKALELTGKRFGRLQVIKRVGSKCGHSLWLCKCNCGAETYVTACALRKGDTVSCGCWKDEQTAKRNVKHKHSSSRLYAVWKGIKQRCNNPNHSSYANYGGRGIKMCKEWENFSEFEKWAMEHGYDKDASFGKCTIERIDNNGPYCPDNCRFATWNEQQNNSRNNHRITISGETHTLTEWCDKMGLKPTTVLRRIKGLGWSEEKAIMTPARKTASGRSPI